MFEVVGLDEPEERAYRFLIEHPGSNAAAVGKAIGVARRQAETILASLEAKTFVHRSAGDPDAFIPLPPEAAVEGPLRDRALEIEAARREAIQLTQRFQGSFRPTHPADIVQSLIGAHAVRERFAHLLRTARSEVLTFDKPPYSGEATDPVLVIEDPGVRSRILFETTALEIPGRLEWLGRHLGDATSARVVPRLPMKLFVADRRIALVPLTSNEQNVDGSLIVHESPLLDALLALFETLWARAMPLASAIELETLPSAPDPSSPEPSAPTPDDLRILGLLAGGLKDHSIARALGVSRSTVERRMKDLMEKLGADSRFQIGYLAARRGWLTDTEQPGGI